MPLILQSIGTARKSARRDEPLTAHVSINRFFMVRDYNCAKFYPVFDVDA
jgi:hypothetical protein